MKKAQFCLPWPVDKLCDEEEKLIPSHIPGTRAVFVLFELGKLLVTVLILHVQD